MADAPAQILMMSAPTAVALREAAQRCQKTLRDPACSLTDLAMQWAEADGGAAHRLAAVAKSCVQAAERLHAFVQGQPSAGLHTGTADPRQPTRVALVFSGQGTQWWGMGRQLLAREAVFARVIERIDGLLREHVTWSLLEELQRSEAESLLGQTQYAQPALFALQTALFALLQQVGLSPSAVVGHSIGEVAAAQAAGVLTLEDAVRLSAVRGQLMQEATGLGKMLSADLSAEQAAQWAAEHSARWAADHLAQGAAPQAHAVDLAAVNGPRSVVLAGDAAAMDRLAEALGEQKVPTRWLPVNYAFHSAHMDGIAPRLAQALGGLQTRPPTLPIVSSLTGQWAAAHQPAGADSGVFIGSYTASYWQRQMRCPVRFSSAIGTLIDDGISTFLEVGPHPALSANVHEILAARGVAGAVAFTLRRNVLERDTLLNACASLHCRGVHIDAAALLRMS